MLKKLCRKENLLYKSVDFIQQISLKMAKLIPHTVNGVLGGKPFV